MYYDELRAIYRQYVPYKTDSEVDSILSKFRGREQQLLVKVKAKYTLN